MVLVTKMDFAVDRGGGEEPCRECASQSEWQLGNWATTAAKLATSLLTSFRVVVDEVSHIFTGVHDDHSWDDCQEEEN